MPDPSGDSALSTSAARDIVLVPLPIDTAPLHEALLAAASDRRVFLWPECPTPESVGTVVTFRPPAGIFTALPSLRLIHSTGAGINALLAAADRPAHVPMARVVGEAVTQGMAQHIVHAVLREQRDYRFYDQVQREGRWARRPQRHAHTCTVGIMGFGALGQGCGTILGQLGFQLRGWNRSRRQVEGVDCFAGREELPAFLAGSDMVVVLLPLTPETHGILNAETLAMLPRGAIVITAGRGGQIDEPALLAALDSGQIGHAHLDVMAQEPLPGDSPLWHHPGITLTPHIAAAPEAGTVANLVMENIRRVESGLPLLYAVDVERGY